jgi:hypothetical protein
MNRNGQNMDEMIQSETGGVPMYINTGYLNHSHLDFKDKSRPLVVGKKPKGNISG